MTTLHQVAMIYAAFTVLMGLMQWAENRRPVSQHKAPVWWVMLAWFPICFYMLVEPLLKRKQK